MRDQALWDRLQRFEFDDPEAEMPFSKKLAAIQGWTEAQTARAIEEYRRYIYLAVVSDGQATPPEDVDCVWHLHLTYTRNYWEELCGKVLGRPLHHEPSRGESEDARFAEQYAATRALYREEFGRTAPAVVWRTATTKAIGWIAGIISIAALIIFVILFFGFMPEAYSTLIGVSAIAVMIVSFLVHSAYNPSGRNARGGTTLSHETGADCGGGGCGGD